MTSSSFDSPYLHHAEYWVPAADAGDFPVRQGDLFGGVEVSGSTWDAALPVHPTRELGKASVAECQVARVRPLDAIAHERRRRQVVAGLVVAGGGVRIAFAHTFFVFPVPGTQLDQPTWANFREIGLAARDRFEKTQRTGALTHDARVTLIRRYLYFRFRLALGFEQVALSRPRASLPTRPSPARGRPGRCHEQPLTSTRAR
jgi:hypothetical protein